MNQSKVNDKRNWEKWKKSGAIATMADARLFRVHAVAHNEFNEFGCAHCGYQSGFCGIQGQGTAIWTCGECRRTTYVLADDLNQSSMGMGTKYGTLYPKKKKHPRFGIPKHGAPDRTPPGDGEYFRSRGIGLDSCSCFICGSKDRTGKGEGNYMLNNICGFVSCKAAGERVVAMFERGAFLDYREHSPDRVQVKIGACDKHLSNLENLERLIDVEDIIVPEMLDQADLEVIA